MRRAGHRGGWPRLRGARAQRGQALIYGLFVLIAGLAALFFLFNTGQLTREKTKLVNTADAAAYSAGVMHARALNYQAYTNRAMVANTVAIAQLVSLSSWIQYTNTMATWPTASMSLTDPKFALYYPSYYAALYSGPYLNSYLVQSDVLEELATSSDEIIRNVLMDAQKVAYEGTKAARLQVMNEVAQANYRNDGVVTVDALSLNAGGTDFDSFVSFYEDDERTRFAEVATTSANKDAFVKKRSWSLPSLWGECLVIKLDWLDRRGGTNLIGFDEWKAMDTLAEKRWKRAWKGDVWCTSLKELPLAWGLQSATEGSTAMLPDPRHHDGSLLINPGTTAMATFMSSSSEWDYSGLPNFYDLSEDALGQDDPRLRFAVRLRRNKGQTLTSEGRSQIGPSDRLNAYEAAPAGGDDFVAVSASEAFFERPPSAGANRYAGGREIGSLFNPYWQTRLVQWDDKVRLAQTLQGAVLP